MQLSTSSPIAVLGVRVSYNERGELLMSTTSPSNGSTAAFTDSLVFPYIVDGQGSITQLILFSGQAGQTSSGTVKLFSPTGSAWEVPLR